MENVKLNENEQQQIELAINGNTITVDKHLIKKPLAMYLREHLNLTGTKIVCAEGDCGACTVLVQKPNQSEFTYINSCIAPVFLFHHCSIITIEGLAKDHQLSEVQQKMVDYHGGQCGFCTPGMTCAMACLAEDCKKSGLIITEKKAKNYLTGNLCRCTGYEPIINAATHIQIEKWQNLTERYPQPFQQDEIKNFYSEFQDPLSEQKSKIFFTTSLHEALELKNTNPRIRLLAGATDVGVIVNKGKLDLNEVLSLQYIPELSEIKETSDGLTVGAAITLSEFEKFIVQFHPELKNLLHVFASPQIKNQGTVVGNLMNGSPIGDTIPALMALDTCLHFESVSGQRNVLLKDFYLGYKKLDLFKNEICTGFTIPQHHQNWRFKFYKQSLRKDLDISSVTYAAAFEMSNNEIIQSRIVFGGVGPTVQRIPEIENQLNNQLFEVETFNKISKEISKYIHPLSDLRGSKEYRLKLASHLILKSYYDLVPEIEL